jgi:hypothetical protein
MACIWTRSEMDNQLRWFAMIRDRRLKSEMTKLIIHTKILDQTPVIIPVFFDQMLDLIRSKMPRPWESVYKTCYGRFMVWGSRGMDRGGSEEY